jgi:muramoyltetrapeptide carboxypeptidase
MQASVPYEIAASRLDTASLPPGYQPFVINSGQATGALHRRKPGLALRSGWHGNTFAPIFKNKIVFIEDVGEQPYRIDRMLTQLLQATDLAGGCGYRTWVFSMIVSPSQTLFRSHLPDALRDRLGGLGIPVMYGTPFGHMNHQATFPYGIPANLDADKMVLTILDEAVV